MNSRRLVHFLLCTGLLGSVISVLSVFSYYALVFDLLANFRVQYIFLISPFLLLALVCRKFLFALLLGCCLLIHVWEITGSVRAVTTGFDQAGENIRVMSSNLLASNRDYDRYLDYVSEIEPDVIVLQEYTQAWETVLAMELDAYEYRLLRPVNSPFGIALYSKLPIEMAEISNLGNSVRPTIDALLTLGSTQLRIIGTHPPPPMSKNLYRERNTHLADLAHIAKSYRGQLMILGDLNITPWSAHFRQMLKKGKLYSARQGFGILPTWPANFLPLQIPIDHILFNDRIEATAVEVSGNTGSDHKSIWADLKVQ